MSLGPYYLQNVKICFHICIIDLIKPDKILLCSFCIHLKKVGYIRYFMR
jgi:hypothetical protein